MNTKNYNQYLFLELDECSVDNSSNCSEYANCTNIMGSYMCECNPGYTGNGSYCEGMLYLFIPKL